MFLEEKELKEIIIKIYEKIIEVSENLEDTRNYFTELVKLNEKYNRNTDEVREASQAISAKHEILEAILENIHNILNDYNTTIPDLKKEIDN